MLKSVLLFFALASSSAFACKTDQIYIKRETSLNLKSKEGKLKTLLEQNQILGLPFSFNSKAACVDRKGKLSSAVVRSSNELKNEFVVGFPESKFKKIKGEDYHYAIINHNSSNSVIDILSVTCVQEEVLFADSTSFDLTNLDRERPVFLDHIAINMFIATGSVAQNLKSLFQLPESFKPFVKDESIIETESINQLQQPSVITGGSISFPGQKYNTVSSSMLGRALCQKNVIKKLAPYLVNSKNPTFEQSYFEVEIKNNIMIIK
ncbi:MAG: hypothetical protein Fur0010_09860 [Bdellovibrio sp.]